MSLSDKYRKKELAKSLVEKIRSVSRKKLNIMEICGTHTHALSRSGIREVVPENIRLISGPGCPVCVTPGGDVSGVIEFAEKNPEVTIATFGDMMKVPGGGGTLQEAKARGADVRVLYSPFGAVEMARKDPSRQVVLFSVGFETTVPTVASVIMHAELGGLDNLSVLSLHKLTPPGMRAIMESGEVDIDGFLCPGHVTSIIGARAYEFLASEYSSPCVVAGFEPLDVLYGLLMLVKQAEEGRAEIEIEYDRVVKWDGNPTAKKVMDQVFEPMDADWRGIGVIPGSGLGLRDRFRDFDAARRFDIKKAEEADPPGCGCGDVLKGVIDPTGCPLFATACTPASPVGPCMVSAEGTCAAYFKYRAKTG